MNMKVDLKQNHSSTLLVYELFSRKRAKPPGEKWFYTILCLSCYKHSRRWSFLESKMRQIHADIKNILEQILKNLKFDFPDRKTNFLKNNNSLTSSLCSFSIADMTNYHKLSGSKQHKCVVLLHYTSEAQHEPTSLGQDQGVSRAAFLSGGSWERPMSLPFHTSRRYPRSLACGSFLHPQSQHRGLSPSPAAIFLSLSDSFSHF